MKETQSVKHLLQQAKKIRQNSRTSCVDLQNYLLYQQLKLQSKSSSLLSCSICARPKTETSQQFKRAFKTMSRMEQAEFYLMNVKNVEKYVSAHVKKIGDQTQVMEVLPSFAEPVVKMKFQIKDGRNFKKFEQVNVEIVTKDKLIRINDIKQQIDLHSYLLRKSRGKVSNCLVLESIQAFTPSDTIRICFNSIDFEDSLNILYRVWEEAQYQKIKKMLIEENKFPRRIEGRKLQSLKSLPSINEHIEPITAKLSDKKSQLINSITLKDSIKNNSLSASVNKSTQLRKIQNKLVSNELLHSLNTFTNFNQQSFGLYTEKDGKKVRKCFQLKESQISMEKVCLAIDDVKYMKRRKPYIKEIKHLNSIPSQRTNLYWELDEVEGKDYQFVYLRHYFTKDGATYYFQKSVDLEQFKNKSPSTTTSTINYCIWRIKNTNNKIDIIVQCDIVYNEKLKNQLKVTSSYIGEFVEFVKKEGRQEGKKEGGEDQASIQSDQFQNQYISEISNNEEEFFTVTGSLNSTDQGAHFENKDVQLADIGTHTTKNFLKSPSSFQKLLQQVTSRQTAQQTQSSQLYLRSRHQLAPKVKGEPVLMKQPEGHILFGNQWVISGTGEMVNMNKEKIKVQSSVLKLVIQRMGRNLLSGKSIMNMSLPIQIFGTDSNLQRISRGYIFAPIFLERAAKLEDPVERLKNIFCFGLGFSTSYIKMQKPFNPVLGETYQGVIDGCPVYAEQISHHPPITSTLMIGRGYRVHGNFEAKVQMGLNSASGINEGFNVIDFELGNNKVKFNTPPGQIQGVIMGDRKLTLIKKSHYIDEKNMLFCEISWGKNKNSTRQDNKLNDFFSGKIVKLKPSANINDYKNIKKKDIEIQCGQLHGRFTGKIFFEDQLLFDQAFDAPYLIEDYVPCIQSDSRLRKDIIWRRKKNFDQAQDAKQQIQEAQRRDKKLRKQFQKK